MLNRTNQTLSANSNRLNLGTRSLARNTGANMQQPVRIRHAQAHSHIIEVGSVRLGVLPVLVGRGRGRVCGSYPGSSFAFSRFARTMAMRRRVLVVAEAPPVERPVVADDPRFDTERAGARRLLKPATTSLHAKPKRATAKQSCQGWRHQAMATTGSAARATLASAAAAYTAAAGG